jgi:hypothetical protein
VPDLAWIRQPLPTLTMLLLGSQNNNRHAAASQIQNCKPIRPEYRAATTPIHHEANANDAKDRHRPCRGFGDIRRKFKVSIV